MKVILPILAFVILLTAAWKLTQMQPKPKAKAVEKKIPFVEIIQAEKVDTLNYYHLRDNSATNTDHSDC